MPAQPVARLIYLDHAATTPVAPAVLAAMLPYFTEFYGNPSSLHGPGRRASVALQQARRTIAEVLGARPSEIIFTSGGTESDNSALRGIALARRAQTGADRIITTPVEHKAVLSAAETLRDRDGFRLTMLPVDREGVVAVADLVAALGDGADVALVSVIFANNEVGAIQPIAELGAVCRRLGVPFHTDAVQALGKLPVDVAALQVDALSGGAHKFYGPKGAGFLYLRSGAPFWPVQVGGSHEGGRRAGTENIPLIVGMAAALQQAEAERTIETQRLCALRDRLIGGVLEEVDGALLTGPAHARLPNHASFLLPGADAEGTLIALDLAGIAASSGSACASGSRQPSHVLAALGIDVELAGTALRFSLGRATTAAEIDYVLVRLPEIVARVRG